MKALSPWIKEKIDQRACVDCPECRSPAPVVDLAENEGWGDIVFECSMCGRFQAEAWPDEDPVR